MSSPSINSGNINNYLATISNSLVYASYDLSLLEKRLLMLFISTVNNHNVDELPALDANVYYEINVKDYAELYGIEYKNAKEEIEQAVDRLFKQDLWYFDEDGKQIRTRWISTVVSYDKDRHSLNISLSKGIIPLISELRRSFTSYRMLYLAELDSYYSVRLYEILYSELKKSRKSVHKVQVQVLYLRQLLQVLDKYSDFNAFFTNIIEKPIEEVNQKTNICVRYVGEDGKRLYIKNGRKVVAVGFVVSYKDKK